MASMTIAELMARKEAEYHLDPESNPRKQGRNQSQGECMFSVGDKRFLGPSTSAAVAEKLIPLEELRKFVEYDSVAGTINRLRRCCNGFPKCKPNTCAVVASGNVTLRRNRNRYCVVYISKVSVRAPQLAWYLLHGEWENRVYCIDGDESHLHESNLAIGSGATKKGSMEGSQKWRNGIAIA